MGMLRFGKELIKYNKKGHLPCCEEKLSVDIADTGVV